MDENDKDELRRHLERGIGKEASYEEKKARKQRARQRKSESERERPRQRRFDAGGAEDGVDGVEKIRRAVRDDARRAAGTGQGDHGESSLREALVVWLTSGRARVRVGAVDELDASLTQDIAREQPSRIAVGDRVRIQDRLGAPPLVVEVLPRRTRLSRPDPADPKRERLLAANVDVAVLVIAAAEPAFRPGLVDRFLVALADSGVELLVCVNKIDLVRERDERSEIERATATWREIGVESVQVSAHDASGLDVLRTRLARRRAVFVGHSGVGKSSLLNALDPRGERATRAVGLKGRHTTTASTLCTLDNGMELIDTPGLREFGLWAIDAAAVRAAFREFDEHARACRFRDCSHVSEPGCGVQVALDAGRITAERVAAYRRLIGELG